MDSEEAIDVIKVESKIRPMTPASDPGAESYDEDDELAELLDADAIDPTLAFPNPGDVGDELRSAIKKKTMKLKKLFKKAKTQYEDVVELSTQHAQSGKKAAPVVVHTETDKQKISALNARIRDLKEKIEISDSKARSLTVQRVADKKRYEDIIRENEITIGTMNQKIMLAESKKRYQEQISRDPNNYVETLTPMEIEAMKNDMAAAEAKIKQLEEELLAKKQVIDKYTTEMATAQYNLANSERTISKLEYKLDDMIKKESHLQERANEAVREVEARAADIAKELDSERAELKNRTHQVEFLTNKKAELEAVLSRSEAEKKSLKFKCDGLESNEDALKKEIDVLRSRQKVDKEENSRLKASFQEKMKAAAREKDDMEQEWGIRNENLRGKLEAVEEKLKSKSHKVHELEAEVSGCEEKLKAERDDNEKLREELAALKLKNTAANKAAGRLDYVDDGMPTDEEFAASTQDNGTHRRQSISSAIDLVDDATSVSTNLSAVKGRSQVSHSMIAHESDEELDDIGSVTNASVSSARKSKILKKKAAAKPSSRGGSRQASKDNSRPSEASIGSEFEEEPSAIDADDASFAMSSAAVEKNKRPRSRKLVKPSTPSTAAEPITAAHEGEVDKETKPSKHMQNNKSSKKISTTKQQSAKTNDIKTEMEPTQEGKISVSAVSDSTRPDDAKSTVVGIEADHSDLSDEDRAGGTSESEEEKEVLITPYPETRMKQLLIELNGEPSNMQAALKFCAILERSTRMALQDSLNGEKNPNLAHEQVSLAALKLARDLFVQVRKYSIDKLEKAAAEYRQRKPSTESTGGPQDSATISPATVGDTHVISGPPFDKFDKPPEPNFSVDVSSHVADLLNDQNIETDSQTVDRADDNNSEIISLRAEVANLQAQLRYIRRSSLTERPKIEEIKPKKKKPVIIRNTRRSSEAVTGTGKLFRTFYRAKSTASVEETEDGFDEKEEEEYLSHENGEAIERKDSFHSSDHELEVEPEEYEYDIIDEDLEDVSFLRGINVGANEILLESHGFDLSLENDIDPIFNIFKDGRFGDADLVQLTVTERKIMSVEYIIAKCRRFLRENPEAQFADSEARRFEIEKYQMHLKKLKEYFDDGQLAIIPRKYAADHLARLLAAIDKEVTLFGVLFCWLKINLKKHYRSVEEYAAKKNSLNSLGAKLALYNLHRHVIEVCLAAAGGWDTAMTFLARRNDISASEMRDFPESKQIKLLHAKLAYAEKVASKAQSCYASSKESQRQLQELVAVERRFAQQEKIYAQEQIFKLREALSKVGADVFEPEEFENATGKRIDSVPTPRVSAPPILETAPSFGPSSMRQDSFMGQAASDDVILSTTMADINLVMSSFNSGVQSFVGTPVRGNISGQFDSVDRSLTPALTRNSSELRPMASPVKSSLNYLKDPLTIIGSVQAALGSKARELTNELLRAFELWIDGKFVDTAFSLKQCEQYCPLPEESTVESDVVDALLDLVDTKYSNTTELTALRNTLKNASNIETNDGKDVLANREHRAGDTTQEKRLGGLNLKGVTGSKEKKKKNVLNKKLKAALGPIDFIAKLKEKMNSKYIFGDFQREHAQSRYHAAVLAVNKAAEEGDAAAYAEAQRMLLRSQILLLQKHVNTTAATNAQRARYTESATQTAGEDLLIDGSDLELAEKGETLAAHKEPSGFYVVSISSGGYARPGLEDVRGSLLSCDTGLELCTGITLACVTDIMQTIFNMLFDENGESLGEDVNPNGYTWEEIKRSFEGLPAGVALAYKAQRHSFNKGVREWLHGPAQFPMLKTLLPKQIKMVILPRLLQITPEVCMVPGIDLGPSVKLPIDIWAIQGAFAPGGNKNGLPPCMTIVRLSPQLRASRALIELLEDNVEMMQMKSVNHGDGAPSVKGPESDLSDAPPAPPSAPNAPTMLPLSFPVNYEFAPGVKGAPFPEALKEAIIDAAEESGIAWSMPPGVQFVSRTAGTSLPNCLCPVLNPDTKLSEDMSAADQIALSCTVLKTPHGVDLPEGCVLIVRPMSAHNGMTIPLPHGMSFVADEDFPPGLSLAEGINLVRLKPRYDFPPNTTISPEVTIRMCPLGVLLPENVQLVNRKPGALLPRGVQTVSLPSLPKGTHIPANVEAVRFLDGTNLSTGASLAPGIDIVGLEDQKASIPPGILLVRRDKTVDLPPGVVRGLKQDLPQGTLLPNGVEVVKILPRFEIPAGVQLAAGAILPNRIDLPAGTRVGNGFRIERCPQGMFLPPGMALLSKDRTDEADWEAVLPNGFEKVTTFKLQDALRASRYTNQAVYVPLKCQIVTLPHALHLPSGLQIAETFTLVPSDELVPPLPPGLVQVKRPINSGLPSELQLLPPSKTNSSWEISEDEEVLGVTPSFEWPSGIELFSGYEVIRKPPDLAVPVDMCLLRPLRQSIHQTKDPCALSKVGVYVINPKKISSIIARVIDELPYKGCLLAYLSSSKVKIKSWGLSAPGLQVVEKPVDFLLPDNCFLVICNSGYELPTFFRKVPKDFFVGSDIVPPGVEIVEFVPRYFLPRGIGGINPHSLPKSIELSPGEWLGRGIISAALSADVKAKIRPGVHTAYCLFSKSPDFDAVLIQTPTGFSVCPVPEDLIDQSKLAHDENMQEFSEVENSVPNFHGVIFLELVSDLSPLQRRMPTMSESNHSFNNRRGLAPKLKPLSDATKRPSSEDDGPSAVLAAAAETAPQFIHPVIVPPGEISFARPGGPTVSTGSKIPKGPNPVSSNDSADGAEIEYPKLQLFSKHDVRSQITFDEGITEPHAVVELREENLKLRDNNNRLVGEIKIWTAKYEKAVKMHEDEKEKNKEFNEILKVNNAENAKRAAKFKLKKEELHCEIEELNDTIVKLENKVADLVADLDYERMAREAESQIESNPRLSALVDEAVESRTQLAIQEALGHVRAQLMESFISTMVPQIIGGACALVADFIEIQDKVQTAFSDLPQTKGYLLAGTNKSLRAQDNSTMGAVKIETANSAVKTGNVTIEELKTKIPEFNDDDDSLSRPGSKTVSKRGRSAAGGSRPSSVGIKFSHVVDPLQGASGAHPTDGASSVSEVMDNVSLYTLDFKTPDLLDVHHFETCDPSAANTNMYHLTNKPITLLDKRLLRATQDPDAAEKKYYRDLVEEIDAKLRGQEADGPTPGIYSVDGRLLQAFKPRYEVSEAVEQLMSHVVACIDWSRLSSPGSFNGELSPFVDFNELQRTLLRWRGGTMEALEKYYEDITFSYGVSFRLLEKEVEAASKKSKLLTKQLQQTTEMVTVLVGANGATLEGFVHREDALKSKLMSLEGELSVIRQSGCAPTIERLKDLVRSAGELAEQEKRLHLCALVAKQQYRKEEESLAQISALIDTKLSNADMTKLYGERKAINHQMKSISKRITGFLDRAETCKCEHETVIGCIKEEIACFHRVVQGVIPAQILSHLSNNGNILQRGIKSIRGIGNAGYGTAPDVPSSTLSDGGVFSRGSEYVDKSNSIFSVPSRDKVLAPLHPERPIKKCGLPRQESGDTNHFSLSQNFDGPVNISQRGARKSSLSQISASNSFLVDTRKIGK